MIECGHVDSSPDPAQAGGACTGLPFYVDSGWLLKHIYSLGLCDHHTSIQRNDSATG
jgi:hypothetical protein